MRLLNHYTARTVTIGYRTELCRSEVFCHF